MASQRWGMTIPLPEVPLTRQAEVARELEALGYTDLWSAEGTAGDGLTPLAVAATVTTTAHLGVAIAPAFTRGPALLAQTAATLAATAPGRFTLGIGSSSATIVEQWNGVPFDRPWSRCRDVLRFLDRAWSGERVDVGPETGTTSFTVQGFRLGVVPPERPKVLLAALRGRMLRLAGAEADGVVINWLSAADVERVVPIVEEAADGAPREAVARIMVAPTADAEKARALGRRLITGYLTVPVYRDFHRWLGREELEPMWRHWEAGDRRAALDAVPDHVVDELVLHGTPEACREQVQAYAASGVDVPVMSLLPVGEDPLALCRALAPA